MARQLIRASAARHIDISQPAHALVPRRRDYFLLPLDGADVEKKSAYEKSPT